MSKGEGDKYDQLMPPPTKELTWADKIMVNQEMQVGHTFCDTVSLFCCIGGSHFWGPLACCWRRVIGA